MPDLLSPTDRDDVPEVSPENEPGEVTKLREAFQSRLVAANLRTEAVRAGLIDLDGL